MINKQFQVRSVDWFDSPLFSNTFHGEFNIEEDAKIYIQQNCNKPNIIGQLVIIDYGPIQSNGQYKDRGKAIFFGP